MESEDKISLSCLLSDGMVLQRGDQTKVFGKTKKKEHLTIQFLKMTYETYSDEKGLWEVILKDLEAGGPYQMSIIGNDIQLIIKDILIGDVWVCGGQSNMELPINRVVDLYEEEIASYSNSNIRQFLTEQNYYFDKPQEEINGGVWKKVTPSNALEFSAVGYFFAKELYDRYKVPIGLIKTAVGGTPAEAWISEKSLEKFPRFKDTILNCKNPSYIKKTQEEDKNRISSWYTLIDTIDEGYKSNNSWYKEKYDDSAWESMYVPQTFENTDLEKVNGVVWFRKEIHIPKSMVGKKSKIYFGAIVDSDYLYINGTLVGQTGYKYPPRKYIIPEGLLKEGKNIIALRVVSNIDVGGFIKDKPYNIITDTEQINLTGVWKYKIGCKVNKLEGETFFQYKPMGLYNGVIAPLKNYNIKGVIWYQGESNTDMPEDYEELFKSVIEEWRKNWNIGEFPFLYVQLANFMEISRGCTESNWAKVREAQRKALKINNTGMAVAIDLGEYNDLHPQNKKDVGKRLSLAARKIAYGEDIVYSGPLYEDMEKKDEAIYLKFSSIGSGLMVDGGELRGFAICEENGKYILAKAEVEGNFIKVYNENVRNPSGVKYCFVDNPGEVTLYNKDGLPASPFCTE